MDTGRAKGILCIAERPKHRQCYSNGGYDMVYYTIQYDAEYLISSLVGMLFKH